MTESGIFLVLTGLVMMFMFAYLSIDDDLDTQLHEVELADYRRAHTRAAETGTPFPEYPRPPDVNKPAALSYYLTSFGGVAFLAGCILCAAGALGARLDRSRRALEQQLVAAMRTPPRAPQQPTEPTERPSPAGPVAAPTTATAVSSAKPEEPSAITHTESAGAAKPGATPKPAPQPRPQQLRGPPAPPPQASTTRAPTREGPELSPWWPNSPTGSILFLLWLVLVFVGSTSLRGQGLDGAASAFIWYFIVIGGRYLFVVAPARKQQRSKP